jgi:hypothetical protein
MKYIPLLNSERSALVDEESYKWLKHFKWYENNDGYAISRTKEHAIFMHRVINDTPKGMYTDHINGLRLDNRTCNLRDCTIAQNSTNRNISNPGKSQYRGVSWSTRANKWRVMIQCNRKRKQIGMYVDETEAALAYNEEAKKLHGEFAILNVIE